MNFISISKCQMRMERSRGVKMAKDRDDETRDPRRETGVVTKERPKVKVPSLYRVILLNDDFTPMDFVVRVLQKFFSKNMEEATKIMLEVHNQGAGTAGVYTLEIAESKAYLVNQFSRQNKHPLKCIIEREANN